MLLTHLIQMCKPKYIWGLHNFKQYYKNTKINWERSVVEQGHKCVTANATGCVRFPLEGMKCLIFSQKFWCWLKMRGWVSQLNQYWASSEWWKCLNTRWFPGSICLPCYARNTMWNLKKRKKLCWNFTFSIEKSNC